MSIWFVVPICFSLLLITIELIDIHRVLVRIAKVLEEEANR